MQGFRRAAVHLALVALLLRAFLPVGWMPGAPGDAPLVMCSIAAVHDAAGGKDVPVKPDAGTECAFAAAPALAAPEMSLLLAPRLQSQIRADEKQTPAPVPQRAYARPAPRAPPTLI